MKKDSGNKFTKIYFSILQVLMLGVGVYGVVDCIRYFVQTWQNLHSQGASTEALVIWLLVTSGPTMFVWFLCFLGFAATRMVKESKITILSYFLPWVIGTVGYFLASAAIYLYFVLFLWVYSFFK